MSAPDRDELEALDAYLDGAMPDDEAARFEETLFARAAAGDAADAAFVDRVARISAFLADHHTFDAGATRADVEALMRSGLRIYLADCGDGTGPVEIPRWGDDVDLVVLRCNVDLRGVEKLDVEMGRSEHEILKIARDVRFDPADGAVYACCQPALANAAFGGGRLWSRFTAVRDGRREHVAVFEGRTV